MGLNLVRGNNIAALEEITSGLQGDGILKQVVGVDLEIMN